MKVHRGCAKRVSDLSGIPRTTLRRYCKRFNIPTNTAPIHYNNLPELDALDTTERRYNDPLSIHGDTMILNDTHFPYFNLQWCRQSMIVAQHYKIKQCVFAGDLFDAYALSRFQKADKSATLAKEERAVQAFFYEVLDYYDKIYFLPGNHDYRIQMASDHNISLEKYIHSIIPNPKLYVSDYPFCHVNDDYLVGHASNASVVPLSVPRAYASKYQKHIAIAHTHQSAQGYDASGKFMCCELGGLFDRDKLAYVSQNINRYPMCKNGFGLIYKDGFTLFNDSTNWGLMGIEKVV